MLQLRGLQAIPCCRPCLQARSRIPQVQLFYKPLRTIKTSHHDSRQNLENAPTVAIIGSGPAGFYTAQKLMRGYDGIKIDMYEQLPVPFGLVRFGVAPDHSEVKNCQDTFQDVATSPNYNFIGNIHLGQDLPLSLLAQNYDAIVFAYGASKDRKLGLKGEEKSHIYSARAFVGWYNGLPEYRDLNPDLESGETAIIIGQGNVALDVARTLLSKIEKLKNTDITDYALKVLSKSKIKHVHVVGRRGPMQAAFTIKEIRELIQMEDVNFIPIPGYYFPQKDFSSLPRPRRRMMELLKIASTVKQSNPEAKKSWSLNFLLSPTSLKWSEKDSNKLEGIVFNKTKLENHLSQDSPVSLTSDQVTLSTSTLFRSIGYKAEPIPGMNEIGAEFDERKGIIQHDGEGRIKQNDDDNNNNTPTKASLYCAGWVKKGPTGVIASTMTDAFETAEAMISDFTSKQPPIQQKSEPKGWTKVQSEAKKQGIKLRPVHWNGWEEIDRREKEEGMKRGKPREKFGTVGEMLDVSLDTNNQTG